MGLVLTRGHVAFVRDDREHVLVELANLIPGGQIEPPDFPAPWPQRAWRLRRRCAAQTIEHAEATSEFDLFLDQNFPRKKFGELRDELDRASRSKVTTPVQFYRSVVEARRLLRSAAIIMDWYARTEDRCPTFRLCAVCGRIFAPPRKDKMTCMEKCGARVRQARKRALAEAGGYEWKSERKKGNKEYEQKQKKLKAKGAPK